MTLEPEIPNPLTTEQIIHLPPLPPSEKPPESLTINLSTFQLIEGARLSLVSIKESPNTYQVQITLAGESIGHRLPFARIPAEPLMVDSLKESDSAHHGLRPLYLPVAFTPERVKLTPNERSKPPFDFDYMRNGVPVDRPTSVFAPDGRYIYNDTRFPWCTVGRVDTPIGTCTGCTIGSRLLLTASHCIQWNEDHTTGWVRFRPSYYNGSVPFGEAWATRVIYWMQTIGSDGLTDQETAFDYVICVLDTRIGDVVGYSGYRTYNDSWNGGSYWQHMGYPIDLSGLERPAFQGSAIISSVGSESASGQTGYVLGHFNDVVAGHSGGPVWGWWSNEPWPRVVGTQSTEAKVPAQNTSGDNEFGGGPALASLIAYARAKYS